MDTFLIYVRSKSSNPEDMVVVRDEFSWCAFAFNILYFLYNGLWRGALVVLSMFVIIGFVGDAVGVYDFYYCMFLLLMFYCGISFCDWRGSDLLRLGYECKDVVVAPSQHAAMLHFLHCEVGSEYLRSRGVLCGSENSSSSANKRRESSFW